MAKGATRPKPKKSIRRSKKPALHRARKRRGARFKVDPPPVVSVSELAKLAGVSPDTIQRCEKEDPDAPPRLGEKYHREAWLSYLTARKIYGPRYWKVMTAGERAAAISGSVVPEPIKSSGGPTPANLDHLEKASDETTTPAELLRLTPGDLLKTKMAEEILARRLARLERKRRLIPRAEVEEHLFARAQQMLSFKRQIILELSPKLVGLERPEIESRLREALDELFRRIATLGDPIKAPAATAQESPATTAAPAEAPPDEKKPG